MPQFSPEPTRELSPESSPASAPESRRAGRGLPPGAKWVALTAGLAAILVGLLLLFIMPALKSGPSDLPLGVVGPEANVSGLASTLDSEQPGAFVIEPVAGEDDLRDGVRSREFAGGLALEDGAVVSYVASAGSTSVSATVAALGESVADQLGLAHETIDVVPLPESDRSGVGIGGLAFPLVFGGIVPVVAYRAVLAKRRGWILAGLLGFSAVGGLVVAGVLKFVFGSIEHSVLPVAGAVALGIAALALPLAGLNDWFGGKGFTIAAMVMMFVGNPFAGIATGASWLPQGVAVVGQALPPGAAGTLVRAVAYFEGAGGGVAALTLGAWAVAGLALYVTAPAKDRVRRARGAQDTGDMA